MEDALRAAGYTQAVVRWAANRVAQGHDEAGEEVAPLSQTGVSQGIDDDVEMSTKRMRPAVSVSPQVKKYVKGCMKRMLEVHVQGTTNTLVPGTAGTILSTGIAGIVAGTGPNNRTGDIIHLKRLFFKLYISNQNVGGVRYIIFADRAANGDTPNVSDILGTSVMYGTYNPLYVIGHGGARYAILLDKTVVVNPGTLVVGGATILTTAAARTHTLVKNVQFPVTYSASTGVAADVSKNNVWCLMISPDATTSVGYSFNWKYVDN